MPKSTVDPDLQRRLKRVLDQAKGNLDAIRMAVFEAIKGVAPGRKRYLRDVLKKRAKRKILAQQRRMRAQEKAMLEEKKFQLTSAQRRDARSHELRLLNGVPEHDR